MKFIQNMRDARPIPAITQVQLDRASPINDARAPSDFALSGLIGLQLSEPLASMQAVLEDIDGTRSVSKEHMHVLRVNVDAARKLAMQSQQIARLASGRLRQSHETMKLDKLVLAALQERSSVFRQRGIDVFQRIRPVEVIVDAALLHSLVDAALDWAAGLGRKLTVTLEMMNWPEHGLLVLKTSHLVDHLPTGSDNVNPNEDTVGWYLLSEICQVMGLSVKKASSAADTSLSIEFARTVKRLGGLSAVEMETGPESMYGESKPMAGVRLLVVTDDARLQAEIRSICNGTGLVVDCVLNAGHGIRFCELQLPNLVIIDQNMRSPVFDRLYEDLRQTDPDFPFIEIASAANTLEMAGWTSDSMSRLSRDVLASHLAETVMMDLAKVM